MNRTSIKTTAEAALRELPSVLGAYVSEDLEGNPREVHLLVRAGPDLALLARDLRGLLQERLGIPIDQRVISIAQLAADDDADVQRPDPASADAGAGTVERTPTPRQPEARAIFGGIESTASAGQVTVVVELEWQGTRVRGAADAAETTHGRARAAATATLRAAVALVEGGGELGLDLDFATTVHALDGDYALVSVLALSGRTGRRPIPLVGAQPVESDVESATAFATLKAVNRVLGAALPAVGSAGDQRTEGEVGPRDVHPRHDP
jgi:hypothetical protein